MSGRELIQETIVDASLGLDYELTGSMPVQGVGTIGGREFYFRARHSNWEFEVADDLGNLPSDAGGNSVFHVSGRFRLADEMSAGDAVKIIAACARAWLDVVRPKT